MRGAALNRRSARNQDKGETRTFTWSPVPGADQYEIEIMDGYEWVPVYQGTVASAEVTLPLGANVFDYFWRDRQSHDAHRFEI